MELKLGLDIGVASIGWGIIDENYEVIDCGVRLFSEGTAENNANRRDYRSSRRRIRRRRFRLDRMKSLLNEILGVMVCPNSENVYELRIKGLKEKLPQEELAAVILHLTKRRGSHFLMAEDFEKQDGEAYSVEEIIAKQEDSLSKKYVCEVQAALLQKSGYVRGIENRYKNKHYLKELECLLEIQGEYYPNIKANKEKIIEIYSSKREYFEGPGGKNSRTPYGRYRFDEKGNPIEVNLIDIMRGKCIIYPDEYRCAKNTYTSCLFNLLNDLNNLKIDDRSLTVEEKKILLNDYIDKGNNVNLQVIQKVTGVKREHICGYRVDKNDKPIFTEFKGYKKLLNCLKKANVDNKFLLGNRELVDKISEILTKEKDVEERYKKILGLNISKEAAAEIKKCTEFTQYHSLSAKAMNDILEDLMETNKNQMQLFTENGCFNKKYNHLKGTKIIFNSKDWIVSPVTKRAVNETIKIINAVRRLVRRRYQTDLSYIVIEMAREKNTDDKKRFIQQMQRENENLNAKIKDLTNRKLAGKQFQLLKLLVEQDFKCAYSQRAITLDQVFETGLLEIDHIIPLSLSMDDSQSNKVAVFYQENEDKGQRTPFQYFHSGKAKIDYKEYEKWVLETYRDNRRKRDNLLYKGDPANELRGFIERNLVDTRYASRKVLELLQNYAKANGLGLKVSTVKSSFTHYFRKKAKLLKDRETNYAHHAQDALIVAGLAGTNLMKKVNALQSIKENDNEKNIIIREDDFRNERFIRFIKVIEALCRPKYSFKVDRKPNRSLYAEQVKSTRITDDGEKIITKYKNIYGIGKDGSGEKLKKKIIENPQDILMYHYNPKTFSILKEIVDFYKDSKNPFYDYLQEHGKIRKYAKNNQGPEINDIKVYDGKLGIYRENSKQKGKNKAVYLKIKSLRADVYLDQGHYKFITVPYDMIYQKGNEFFIDKDRYAKEYQRKRISDKAEFIFSLYRGEIFSYIKEEKEGKIYQEWIFNGVNNDTANKWDVRPVSRPPEKQIMITIGKKIINLAKYHTDILGNRYEVRKEELKYRLHIDR